MAITITPTQLLPQQVRLQKQLDLKALFTATDNSGTIDHYKITTNVGFGGSVNDSTAATGITGASQTIIVSAADALNYIANNAVGTESFTIQASDDGGATYSNAATISEKVVANSAPSVMAVPNPANSIIVNKTYGASQLFQASDLNFDSIASYTITTPASGGGVFTMINGAHTSDASNRTGALAAGTTYTISGADLANLTFTTAATAGNTSFQVSASDGLAAGTATTVSVNVNLTGTPNVTTLVPAKPIVLGSLTPASNLIQASDPDGTPISSYSIHVSSTNSGFFTLDGVTPVTLDAGNNFSVNAANFANLQYKANATTAGTDSFSVTAAAQPNGSTVFSTSTALAVTVTATAPAVVTQSAAASSVTAGTTINANTLFSATDPKGNPVVGYSIIPSKAGQFTLNGVALTANTPTFVSAANLPLLKYVAGTTAGTANFQVAASDGNSLGAFATITVTTGTGAPTINPAATTPKIEPNNPVAASSLFTGTEAGGTIQGYSIIVPASLGHLTLNGTSLANDQPVFVSAADFANLTFVATATPGNTSFQAAAYDGKGYSAYTNVPVNLVGPTVTQASTLGSNSLVINSTYAANKLFSLSGVSGGTAITGFSIQTPPASEGIFYNGTTALASNQPVFLNATDLANITLQTSATAGPVTFQVSAFDGIAFGQPKSFSLNSVANSEPTVAAVGSNPQVTVGRSVSASSLFNATDVNNDAITAYQITPSAAAGAGVFSGTGLTFTPGVATIVTAAQFATLHYTGGSIAQDSFTVAATDDPAGLDFSASTAATIKVASIADQAPTAVALPQTLPILTGDSVAATSLFSATDPDGGTVQAYSIVPPPASVGTFSGFTSQDPVSGTIYVTAADLANLKFTAGTAGGTGSYQISAFDGTRWSNATTASVATSQPQPPTVALTPPTVLRPNATIAAKSLFSATDPRGATILAYSIQTPSNGNGYFTLNGVRLPDNTQNYVTAAQLSSLSYVGGSVSAPANFSISAFNGKQWSSYATEQVNVSVYKPPVVKLATASTTPSVIAGGSFSVSALIGSVTTDSGSAVQKYVVSASDGSFTLNGKTTDAKVPLTVNAADLPNLKYVAGATLGNVTVNIAANDGTATGASVATTLAVTKNGGPVLTQTDKIGTLLPGQAYQASTLFNATDPSGLAITGYFVTAQTGDGRFQLTNTDGTVTTIAQGTKQFVSIADLSKLQYVTGSGVSAKGALKPAGTVVGVDAANQGSGYSSATVTLPAPPAGGTQATATAQVVNGKVVSVTITNPGSGYTGPLVATLSGDGTGASGPVLDLSQPSSSFTVSAADSVTEGAPITVLVNPLANVTSTTVIPASTLPKVAPGGTVNASALLSAIGAAGAPIAAYNLSTDLGTFTLNGVPLTTGQLSFITPDVFASLVYTAPSAPGTAHIQALAQDTNGTWSPAVQIALSVA